jgi:hypothetical protein
MQASIEGLNPQDLDLLAATGPDVPGFELLGWSLGALVLVQFILRAASVAASADFQYARGATAGYSNCQRKGRYSVSRLIEKYGRNANMMKWKEQLNGVTKMMGMVRVCCSIAAVAGVLLVRIKSS